jgi:hypothetical protein
VKLSTAVRRALRELETVGLDSGARELALTYAREIDGAELVHVSLAKVLREVAGLDSDVHDRLVAQLARVERVHVVGLLGPKLLAALEALELSPRARAAIVKVGAHGRGPTPLDQLRQRRAARVDDTSTVDTAAT